MCGEPHQAGLPKDHRRHLPSGLDPRNADLGPVRLSTAGTTRACPGFNPGVIPGLTRSSDLASPSPARGPCDPLRPPGLTRGVTNGLGQVREMPPWKGKHPLPAAPRVAPFGTANLDQPASVVASTRTPGPMVELSATRCT